MEGPWACTDLRQQVCPDFHSRVSETRGGGGGEGFGMPQVTREQGLDLGAISGEDAEGGRKEPGPLNKTSPSRPPDGMGTLLEPGLRHLGLQGRGPGSGGRFGGRTGELGRTGDPPYAQEAT